MGPDIRDRDETHRLAWGVRRHGETDYRRMAEEAGFTDLVFRYRGTPPRGGELLVSGRKPAAARREATLGIGESRVEATEEEAIPTGPITAA